ncbi:MAG: hypothetical protein ACI9HI_002407 [Salinirussus sp.]|jgi:hypothetical protein
MSFIHQVADVVIGGLIAGVSTFAFGAVMQAYLAVSVGAFLAATFYFSRNPWGSPDGDQYNEMIDDVYDRYLP